MYFSKYSLNRFIWTFVDLIEKIDKKARVTKSEVKGCAFTCSIFGPKIKKIRV